MIDGQHTFATEIRVLICDQCRAPLPAPTAGGVATCEYCGTSRQVAPRPVAPDPLCPPQPGLGEAERIAMLRQQAQVYETVDNPYGYAYAPPGLETLQSALVSRGSLDPTVRQMAETAYYRGYSEARANPADAAGARRLSWAARVFVEALNSQDQFLRSRAVLEATAEVLRDPGYRYILYVDLSKAARGSGELDASEGWLSLCHPRPMYLDLDSNYRVAAGCLALV